MEKTLKIKIYLYGASGHGKVIADIVRANGLGIAAFVDDNEAIKTLAGYPVLHGTKDVSPLLISIGNNRIRKKLALELKGAFITAIHPSAILSSSATVGEGSVVMQGAVIQADASIGKHVIVNTSASIDHDCLIADYCHLSPHSTLCGNVTVGEGSWVCAGATVIQGVTIGKDCTIAAGAVVTKDVPDGAMVAGIPAKIIRINS